MIASCLSISMSTSELRPAALLGPSRVGTRSPLVNAICRHKHSTSTFDLRIVPGDRPLGNADVDVGGTVCQRQDLPGDREFQAEVAGVPEAEPRTGREHQGQLAVAGHNLTYRG